MCALLVEPNHKRSVLIADDDDVARGLLKSVLQAAGLHVIGEAADGKQALSEAKRLQPDVVCLDIEMPLMTGTEVVAALRKEHPQLIALLVTAAPTAQNIRGAIQAGADGVIAKPFNLAKIQAEIDLAATRRKKLK